VLLDVTHQGFAKAIRERQVHNASFGEMREYKWQEGVGSKANGEK
jgi:hypothetical protein